MGNANYNGLGGYPSAYPDFQQQVIRAAFQDSDDDIPMIDTDSPLYHSAAGQTYRGASIPADTRTPSYAGMSTKEFIESAKRGRLPDAHTSSMVGEDFGADDYNGNGNDELSQEKDYEDDSSANIATGSNASATGVDHDENADGDLIVYYQPRTRVGQVWLPSNGKSFRLIMIGHSGIPGGFAPKYHARCKRITSERLSSIDTEKRMAEAGIVDPQDRAAVVRACQKDYYTDATGQQSTIRVWKSFVCLKSTKKKYLCALLKKGYLQGDPRLVTALKTLHLHTGSQFRLEFPADGEEGLDEATYNTKRAPRLVGSKKAADTMRLRRWSEKAAADAAAADTPETTPAGKVRRSRRSNASSLSISSPSSRNAPPRKGRTPRPSNASSPSAPSPSSLATQPASSTPRALSHAEILRISAMFANAAAATTPSGTMAAEAAIQTLVPNASPANLEAAIDILFSDTAN